MEQLLSSPPSTRCNQRGEERPCSMSTYCKEKLGHQHHKQRIAPCAKPDVELILLKCELDAPENSPEGEQWRRAQSSGLGPFLLLYGQSVQSINGDQNGEVCYNFESSGNFEFPPAVWCLLCTPFECGTSRVSLRLHSTCPLRQSRLAEQHGREDPARRFVFLVNEDKSVVVTSAGSLSRWNSTGKQNEHGAGEATGTTSKEFAIINPTQLLMILFRQTSLWNMSFFCKYISSRDCLRSIHKTCVPGGVRREMELALHAVSYVGKVVGEPLGKCEAENLMKLLFGWLECMHKLLINSPSIGSPWERETYPTDETTCRDCEDQHGPPVTLKTVRRLPKEESTPQEEAAAPPLKPLAPHNLLPSMLRSSSMRSVVSSTLGAEESAEDATSPQQAQEFSDATGSDRQQSGTKYGADLCRVLSVCDDILVGAFHLQRQRTESSPRALSCIDEKEGVCECSFTSVITGHGATAADSCQDMHTPLSAWEHCDTNARLERGHTASKGNDGSTPADGFLPSLVLRTASGLLSSSAAERYRHHLSAIARGDFFPSKKALEKIDVLQQQLKKATKVWFYDLCPQHLLGTSDTTAAAAMMAHGGGSGQASDAANNTGHPCYLHVTETDIVLASAFDNINKRQMLASRAEDRPAQRGMKTFEKGATTPVTCSANSRKRCADSKRSFSEPPVLLGENECDDCLDCCCDDETHSLRDYVKLRLVIPRASLMDVQRLPTGEGSLSAVLLLQTRGCRRVWLAFRSGDTINTIHGELTKPIIGPNTNCLLASARRSWRMAGLTLAAADILPKSHVPFYRRVIQNILVALVDLEERGSQQREQEREIKEDKGKQRTNDWWLYSLEREFERQDIPVKQWRLTTINKNYKHFKTYPESFIVPSSLGDDVLVRTADLRARGRVEALSFYYAESEAGLVRAAQPAAVQAFRVTASPAAAVIDPIEEYRNACMRPLRIFDLRSGIRALGNALVGGGFSIGEDRRFCSLGNIHDVRGSYEALCTEVLNRNPTFPMVVKNFSTDSKRQGLHATGLLAPLAQLRAQSNQSLSKSEGIWVDHIRGLLRTAEDAARLVAGVSEENILSPATASAGSSSIMHIWMRAFHPICRNHAALEYTTSLLSELQQLPSYAPLQNRKDARLVMVNCSDGWDRTAQVCALTQLLLDPYYRTVEGFLILVEKEFVAFGHPFATRSSSVITGQGNPRHVSNKSSFTGSAVNSLGDTDGVDDSAGVNPTHNQHGSKQNSPIMLQFIDAVHQLVRIYPHCFEFTETFLLLIVDLLHAGFVGSFAVDCESDAKRWGVEENTLSLSQFIALVVSTTLPSEEEPVASLGVTAATQMPNDYKECGVRNRSNDVSNASSPSSPQDLPLQAFFSVGGGGSSLDVRNWCPASGKSASLCRPRCLPISCDALLYSGLLNPHFSLTDNKQRIGPLINPLPLEHITLWERFFMRYSFHYEIPQRLRQFSEQSLCACNVHTPTSLRNMTQQRTQRRSLHAWGSTRGEKQSVWEQQQAKSTLVMSAERRSDTSLGHYSSSNVCNGNEGYQQPHAGLLNTQTIKRSKPVIRCGANRGDSGTFTPPARLRAHHSFAFGSACGPPLARSLSHAALCDESLLTGLHSGHIHTRDDNNSSNNVNRCSSESGSMTGISHERPQPLFGHSTAKSHNTRSQDERWSSHQQRFPQHSDDGGPGRAVSLASSLGEGSATSVCGVESEVRRATQSCLRPMELPAVRSRGGYESLLDVLDRAFDV